MNKNNQPFHFRWKEIRVGTAQYNGIDFFKDETKYFTCKLVVTSSCNQFEISINSNIDIAILF